MTKSLFHILMLLTVSVIAGAIHAIGGIGLSAIGIAVIVVFVMLFSVAWLVWNA